MTTGVVNTLTIPEAMKQESFALNILTLMPNGTAPLFALSGMLTSETATQTEHGFWSKTMLFPFVKMTAIAAAGAVDLVVGSTANIIPGQILQNPATRENVQVESVQSATTIRVKRNIGSAAQGPALAVDDVFYQIGNAQEEGSVRPQAINEYPIRMSNLTQIFRNSWAMTDTARAIVAKVGDSFATSNKSQAAGNHAKDIEMSTIFGKKSEGIRNGQPFRTMDGIINIIGNLDFYPPSYAAPNIFTAGATTNYTQLENMLEPVFEQTTDPKNGNQRLVICGSAARRVINNIGRLSGQYQLVDGQTNFGLQFSTFKTARGTFTLMEHPILNSNPVWSKMAIVVDTSTFNYAYLGDRKTKSADFGMDGKAVENGMDAVGGTLTTELTLLIKNPPANAVITNLTAAAKEV